MPNVLSNWWNTGDLGTVDTTVSIDRKSIVIIALMTIVTATIIIMIARASKAK